MSAFGGCCSGNSGVGPIIHDLRLRPKFTICTVKMVGVLEPVRWVTKLFHCLVYVAPVTVVFEPSLSVSPIYVYIRNVCQLQQRHFSASRGLLHCGAGASTE